MAFMISPPFSSLPVHRPFHSILKPQIVVGPQSPIHEGKILCQWKRPPRGFVAINCDGSYQPFNQCVGHGVILRNQCGQFLIAKANHDQEEEVVYSGVRHDRIVLRQELLAIRDGLDLAKELGISRVQIQSDSKNGIYMIGGMIPCPKKCLAILRDIQRQIPFFKELLFSFVYKQSNRSADYLSKILRVNGTVCLYPQDVPDKLIQIIIEEASGVIVPRNVK